MPYIPNTPEDQQAMLEAIGAKSIDELFSMIPAELRLDRDLDLPPAMGEMELAVHMRRLAERSTAASESVCFLGGGSYDHFIPAVVDMVSARGEFYTAYTPYQAEASQGTLQAIFEYQTLIAQLTGMDVSNASLYDGGSAAVEAVLMALGATRRPGRVVVAASVHPEYRQTVATYLVNLGAELVTVGTPEGTVSPEALEAAVDDRDGLRARRSTPTSSAAWRTSRRWPRSPTGPARCSIVAVNPISLGLLKRPGDYGADIVVAEGQPLGNPMAYGGPYLGILACREEFLRRMPGRLVGQTRRPPRAALLGADAPDPRAAHPPREGHEQHLHEPGPFRPARDDVSGDDGTPGPARGGRVVPAKGPLRGRATHRHGAARSGVRPAVFQRNGRSASPTAAWTRCSNVLAARASSPAFHWGAGTPGWPTACSWPSPRNAPRPKSINWRHSLQ